MMHARVVESGFSSLVAFVSDGFCSTYYCLSVFRIDIKIHKIKLVLIDWGGER